MSSHVCKCLCIVCVSRNPTVFNPPHCSECQTKAARLKHSIYLKDRHDLLKMKQELINITTFNVGDQIWTSSNVSDKKSLCGTVVEIDTNKSILIRYNDLQLPLKRIYTNSSYILHTQKKTF